MYVCYRHALLVCASLARQLPDGVSSRYSCSTVCPLRCSLPVPVYPTVARAPMIARRSSLRVYLLLNVSAYCSFSYAIASGVAVGLILSKKLCLHLPLCRSLFCQHTPSWVSRGWPLSSQPAGEDVMTVWRDQIIEKCICYFVFGYAGSELTVRWRVATGLSPLDCCRNSACRGSLRYTSPQRVGPISPCRNRPYSQP